MVKQKLAQIAWNVITAFLAQLGMTPSKDGIEIKDHGYHLVFCVQARIQPEKADCMDSFEVYHALTEYLDRHNAATTAVRFFPCGTEVYVCPCGCGTFLYTSIYI